MDQVKTLLERGITEVVAAANSSNICKASLLVTSRSLERPIALDVIKIGDVFEAQVSNSFDCRAVSSDELIARLVEHCRELCGSADKLQVLLTACASDRSQVIVAGAMSISDAGELQFSQLDFSAVEMLTRAIDRLQEALSAGEAECARLLVNDGSRFFGLHFYGNAVYSNDFDLFVGSPPSFEERSEKPELLKARAIEFLSACFLNSVRLQLRLQIDGCKGRRFAELVADSGEGGQLKEPELFDPPV
ncbi:MAG: hypothetical protein K2X27_26170 [Candidatus Obscuribacterales bacterium]|nr:hypothetical protein [Candidatus Obscuribacterales bacterium]